MMFYTNVSSLTLDKTKMTNIIITFSLMHQDPAGPVLVYTRDHLLTGDGGERERERKRERERGERADTRECLGEQGMLWVSVWENSAPFMYHECHPTSPN